MQHFNLVEEKWLPIAGQQGQASLRDIFSEHGRHFPALGGTVLEKIAVTKLLQAIAQAACTPKDDDDWLQLGEEGMAERCLEYLKKWHEAFWLYHPEKPFLQYPELAQAAVQEYGVLITEISNRDNSTIIFDSQRPPLEVEDAKLALLVLVQISCCFGGKQIDGDYFFSPDITKTANDRRSMAAKSGPAIGATGLLHSFITCQSVRQNIWINLLTLSDVTQNKVWNEGVGTPPWEHMPETLIRKNKDEPPSAGASQENKSTSYKLKHSLMGRLVPMARFLLLNCEGKGVHCAEGLRHETDGESGLMDPSAARIFSQDKQGRRYCKMIEVSPTLRPWRSLASILNFQRAQHSGCPQLEWCLLRFHLARIDEFHIWSGGIKVTKKFDGYLPAKDDDMMESEFRLEIDWLRGKAWFVNLQQCMDELNNWNERLKKAVGDYYKSFQPKKEGEKHKQDKNFVAIKHAETAEQAFWQKVEHYFQALVSTCPSGSEEEREKIMKRIWHIVLKCYEDACPQDTARQLQAFIKYEPHRKRTAISTQPVAKHRSSKPQPQQKSSGDAR